MSGIAGIFNRDGKSISDDISENFLKSISHWQPDNSGTWKDVTIALFHAMLWNTPESKLEQLPKKAKHLCISMDARLDNREELAAQLNIANNIHTSDSDFIVAAYEKWDTECPQHLLGDFAFAIWDTQKQQLFCARDHVGVKQFYFHLTDTLFIFANDLKSLIQHPEISEEINDKAVANFIVNSQLIHPSLTFFKDIQQLPPAHTLAITGTELQINCYWKLEDTPETVLPTAEAYAKQLGELLEQAVHDRMRTAYPVTSHLSGGLDSSSIAVIAARKLWDKGEKLLAFNWLHKPSAGDDPEHHEWSNSKTVAEAEDIDHHYIPLTSEDICRYMDDRNITYGESAAFWYEYPVRAAAHKKGSRTILSGWGGDELATYHGQSFYCDLFLQGKLKTLIREIYYRAKKTGNNLVRGIMGLLYHKIFMVLLPEKLYGSMPRNRALQKPLFPFVRKEFMAAIQHELQKPRALSMQQQRTIREHMLAFWQNGHLQSRMESWATSATAKRLEYSYPLLDKRIVEFVIGIPAEFWIKDGISRYIFRSAVSEILPKKIVWGNSKLEVSRVKRLISLYFAACLSFAKLKNFPSNKSKYINHKKLNENLRDLESRCDKEEIASIITDIETSVSMWNT